MTSDQSTAEEEIALKKAACAYVLAYVANRGGVTAEINDETGYHALTVRPDGSLWLAEFLGEGVPVDADFEKLPWSTLSALVAECQRGTRDANARLHSEMGRFSLQLCNALTAAGCNVRMEGDTKLFVTRNGVRLRLRVELTVKHVHKHPDLSEFIVALHVKRVFDTMSTDIAVGMTLAHTLKGGKPEALVAQQLTDELGSAPLDECVTAILQATS
jgi:hypothetical protein